MKIQNLVNIKTLVITIIFFMGAGIATAGFFKLPARVEKVEKKTEETDDKVQQVASTVDKFVVEQKVIREEENKREQLMLKLIEEVSKK